MREKQDTDDLGGLTTVATTGKEPVWKRILFFDLGVPGNLLEMLLKLVMVVALGSEFLHVLSLPGGSSRCPAPSLRDLSPGQSSPWQMADGVLSIGSNDPRRTAVIALPFRAGSKAYEVQFKLRLDTTQSDLRLLFRVGEAWSALVMNATAGTGLGLSTAASWDSNPTVTHPNYHVGGWDDVRMEVQIDDQSAGIVVWVDGLETAIW